MGICAPSTTGGKTTNILNPGPPPEPRHEAPLLGVIGASRSSGRHPIASPSEADGASSEEEEDERDEGHPESGTSTRIRTNTLNISHLVLHIRKKRNIDGKRDKSDKRRQERDEGRDERDGGVRGEGEEERDEGRGSGDGVDGETASPGVADGYFVGSTLDGYMVCDA